jgi:hypothetical protein
MSAEWTITDAWVFASISSNRAEDLRSLTQVITGADAINHAILLEEEFTGAVGRLVNAGLVGADPVSDRYWMTEAGLELRGLWRQGLFSWMDTLPDGLRRLGEPQEGDCSLPAGAFAVAVHEYLST